MLKKQPQPYHTEGGLITEETVLKLLTESDPSAQSTIYQPLRQRLLDQQASKEIKSMRPFRFALIVGCILLALLTLTPVRSSLAAVLERFGLLQITDAPTIGQELHGQPLAAYELTPAPTGVFSEIDSSVQSISNQIGSHVYFTNNMPNGYDLADRRLQVTSKGSIITTIYLHTKSGSIQINQIYQPDPTTQPFELAIGEAASIPIQVRGVSGLWIEQAPLLVTDDGTGHFTTVATNVLVWSEGDNTFEIKSDRLDQATMLAVAESLQ